MFEQDYYHIIILIQCLFSDFSKLQTKKYTTEGVNYAEIDAKDPETLTEEEKIALLGRPVLGDVTKIQIRIRESKEFKV